MEVNLKSSENIVGSIQMNWVATSMLWPTLQKVKNKYFMSVKDKKNGCSIISLVLSILKEPPLRINPY